MEMLTLLRWVRGILLQLETNKNEDYGSCEVGLSFGINSTMKELLREISHWGMAIIGLHIQSFFFLV
jgi:hypothetical protein